MNGRLYDPLLRRFLNADENIQDMFNTQNYNKYGYVLNNPLMFSDPSGEIIFFIAAAVAWIVSNAAALATAAAIPIHFFESLDVFVSTIKRISELKKDKDVLRSDTFYYYTGVDDISFEGLLKQNISLAWTFRENLQKLNPKSWEKQKIHDDRSSYEFNKESFTRTSVAEIAERKLQDKSIKGVLINFIGSKYSDSPNIDIVKNNTHTIEVDCAMTPESIENWLIVNEVINPNENYNEKSGIAPADYQTVLKDNTKFEKTTYPKNKGRIVYRRIGTNQLWVVDNALKHAGAKAHIEVFDENSRKHLGTSLYNVINIEERFKDNKRSINLGN